MAKALSCTVQSTMITAASFVPTQSVVTSLMMLNEGAALCKHATVNGRVSYKAGHKPDLSMLEAMMWSKRNRLLSNVPYLAKRWTSWTTGCEDVAAAVMAASDSITALHSRTQKSCWRSCYGLDLSDLPPAAYASPEPATKATCPILASNQCAITSLKKVLLARADSACLKLLPLACRTCEMHEVPHILSCSG